MHQVYTANLLTREEFVQEVFKRDHKLCVVCRKPGADAHHIIERKLFDDGGYYLDNGATLCSECHLLAEMTTISCEHLRDAIDIKKPLIPEHLAQDEGERYDKWGNQIMPTGVRLRGELFNDTGCQKALEAGGFLKDFAKHVKFPRTMHLPWSANLQNNDRRIKNLEAFEGKEIVISEKRDGEGTSFYPDYMHARSVDSKDHPSRAIMRQLHGAFAHEIPAGWRICGENLYAQHSIRYDSLWSFFEAFAIWDDTNTRLSWDEMTEWCQLIGVGVGPGFENGIPMVPVLYRGIWDRDVFTELAVKMNDDEIEGYVVTRADRIHLSEWRYKAAKYVRDKHVRTDERWERSWVPNKLLIS